jgi:heme exporter protein CcmD
VSEWLAMGGHGFYIWSAYGMLALAVVVELAGLRRRRKKAWQNVDEARDEFDNGRQN